MAGVVYALLDDPAHAERAVDRLLAAGFGREWITVRSSEPFLEWRLPAGGEEQKSRIPFFALLGGFLGGGVGFSLAALTSMTMNLVTGGMPIIAPGPTGIVTFELTALGAIFGTVISLIAETGLGRGLRSSDLDDLDLARAVADGALLVSAHCPSEKEITQATTALQEVGAAVVKVR